MLKIQSIEIPYQKEIRNLHIYLPDNYNTNSTDYSVLYMLDGHNLFEDKKATFGRSWRFCEFMEKSDNQCIIIGVECDHGFNKRFSEYSPYDFYDTEVGTIDGRAKQFCDWFVTHLIPFVESRFRIKKHRNSRAIGGSSMGGLCSLYMWSKYHDFFYTCLCVSPYIVAVQEPLLRMLNEQKNRKQSIYLSWGANENRRKIDFAITSKLNIDIIQLLQKQNANVLVNVLIEGKHCEASWSKEIPTFMHVLKSETPFFS